MMAARGRYLIHKYELFSDLVFNGTFSWIFGRLQIILDVTSNMAALEVGGGPWFNTWKGKTSTPEILSRALQLPIDVDSIFNTVPLFKPPGL